LISREILEEKRYSDFGANVGAGCAEIKQLEPIVSLQNRISIA
jgi:hypothetical protein